ncbi:MAG: pyruvate synthase [Gammaproteobacteria bacterium]
MQRALITGNVAAAWAARLADVDYVPAFPITPQTEIIETLARWCGDGTLAARLTMLESEHSMITAAASAAAAGARVFTATSSQGLLYGMEMIYAVAGWRAPFVLVNVSRGLASPITLEPDHTDVLAARDSGFLQIHCATAQEVLDAILIAYRLAEHPRVRLPAIVNMDGFYLSFTREPVAIPDQEAARAFLPPPDAGAALRAGRPSSRAVAVLGGSPYSYFRYESHLSSMQALAAWAEIGAEFARRFGRELPAVDAHCVEDAEVVFFMIGAFSTKARDAVNRLREAGHRVGLVRPRLLRPYPRDALRALLLGRRAVAVVDQNLSMGMGGVLHTELAAALYGQPGAPVLASFVGALGGRDIAPEEFFEMHAIASEAGRTGIAPEPRLLYTQRELREVRKLQAIAVHEGEDRP